MTSLSSTESLDFYHKCSNYIGTILQYFYFKINLPNSTINIKQSTTNRRINEMKKLVWIPENLLKLICPGQYDLDSEKIVFWNTCSHFSSPTIHLSLQHNSNSSWKPVHQLTNGVCNQTAPEQKLQYFPPYLYNHHDNCPPEESAQELWIQHVGISVSDIFYPVHAGKLHAWDQITITPS